MNARIAHGLLALLGLFGFAVLMALRVEPSSFGARLAIAALAGACLGAALIQLQKARRKSRAP